MNMRTQIVTAGVAAVVAAGFATGAVATAGDDGDETPITGAALATAEQAALAAVGGGTVSGTEVGDEESKYEVEVTRDDGTGVDVQLDASFAVVGEEADDSDNEADDSDKEGDDSDKEADDSDKEGDDSDKAADSDGDSEDDADGDAD